MSDASQPGHLRRVLGSLSWTLAGEAIFAAGQLGMLVVMARLGSEEALGQYALGLAIATPLLVITSLHLRPTYVVSEEKDYIFGDYLGLRLLGSTLAILLASLWSFAVGHDPTTLLMVTLVALTRSSELVSDMCHAAAGRAERLERVGIGRALRGVLLLATVAAALWLGSTPVWAVGYGAAVGIALSVLYDLPTARQYVETRPRFSRKHMLGLVKLAAPVGLAGGLMALNRNTPAYVLERVDGLIELGRYTAVLSVIYVSGVLNTAMGTAAIPRLARLSAEEPATFVRVLLRVAGVVFLLNAAILVGCVLVGRLYLEIAYGPSFGVLYNELVYAGAIAIIAGVAHLLSQTLVAMRHFRLQFIISLLTFCGTLALSLLLIPSHGALGGLAALGAATALRLVAYGIAVALLTRRSQEG